VGPSATAHDVAQKESATVGITQKRREPSRALFSSTIVARKRQKKKSRRRNSPRHQPPHHPKITNSPDLFAPLPSKASHSKLVSSAGVRARAENRCSHDFAWPLAPQLPCPLPGPSCPG